jgi:outer membrane protein TolC
VQTATLSRELADRQLQAEQRKFEVGTSTNFNVLEFQNQFSSAQLSEVQAIIQLQTAIAQLELTKGTLLQYFGVQLGDAGTGGGRQPAPLPERTGGGR